MNNCQIKHVIECNIKHIPMHAMNTYKQQMTKNII